jgi:cell division protein FtsB
VGLLAYMIFGGDQGLLSLASSWHESWALKREIAMLQASNQDLVAKQAVLRNDRASYEKTAREKLFLKNPGDLIYRFEGKP